jgi:hypothetical protein
MDDMPVTRLRFGAKVHRQPFEAGVDGYDGEACAGDDSEWAPKQLQDLLDEVATAPPTLRERLENWGSD